MRVGLLKTSLIDYPGRVAAVAFLPGCNFACPYCHNPGLARNADAEGLMDWELALAHLRSRRGLLSGLVLTGGEPTLHESLGRLVEDARDLGYAVKLDTNGSNPDRLASLRLDYVAMDLKTSPDGYGALWPGAPEDAARRIAESMAVIRRSGAAYEFRITCAPGIFGPEEARKLAPMLLPDDPVVLQRYRPGEVLDPAWAARVSPYGQARMDELLAIVASAAPKARIRAA